MLWCTCMYIRSGEKIISQIVKIKDECVCVWFRCEKHMRNELTQHFGAPRPGGLVNRVRVYSQIIMEIVERWYIIVYIHIYIYIVGAWECGERDEGYSSNFRNPETKRFSIFTSDFDSSSIGYVLFHLWVIPCGWSILSESVTHS